MRLKNLLIHIINILLILLVIVLAFDKGFDYHDYLDKKITLDTYRDYISENNLTILDFCYNNDCVSDKDIYQFRNLVIDNYYYDDLHDCKYWAMVWALYLEKNNYDYEFFKTDNHVFVIAYHEDGYYVLDGANFYEVNLL